MVSKVDEPNNWGVGASEFHASPTKSCIIRRWNKPVRSEARDTKVP